jgi:putative ABC transport system substrate-binding protein
VKKQKLLGRIKRSALIPQSSVLIFPICALLLALCASANAQQPKKIPRLGILFGASAPANLNRMEAFQRGLRELGYVEGKNVLVEQRYADGKLERLPALAAELVALKVDVLVSGAAAPTRALKEASNTIPIVMAQDNDPVANGFVASLARPGSNITGLSSLAPTLSGKRLEVLKDIIPKLSRVAVLSTARNTGNALMRKETEVAAAALGLQLQYLDVRDAKDLEAAFREASNGRADAALAAGGPVLNAHRIQIAELAAKNRLAIIYNAPEFVEDGGLMSYAVSFTELYRRAATYVDKILKGADPADLPVEQPTKFEFLINLKAAKQIGLTVPPHVLARADKVIR